MAVQRFGEYLKHRILKTSQKRAAQEDVADASPTRNTLGYCWHVAHLTERDVPILVDKHINYHLLKDTPDHDAAYEAIRAMNRKLSH